jgi:RNA polymerase primary sigma factor
MLSKIRKSQTVCSQSSPCAWVKLTFVPQKLALQLGREPTIEETAADLDLTPEKVRLYTSAANTPLSLDAPVGSDEKKSRTLEETIVEETVQTGETGMGSTMLRDDLEGALSSLSYREREVMRMRYGLIDGQARTLEEVGLVFRVTRERIRQIEAKALRKLRTPMRQVRLEEHLQK